MRKYESIVGIHKISNKFFNKGDVIHVSEKIDGANASFMLDEDGFLHFFSRNKELLNGDNLRGFVPWVENNVLLKNITANWIYYGEWVVKHKIEYADEVKNTFILFDVFKPSANNYLVWDSVELEAKILGIKTPLTLYYGEYISLDHLNQFVGISNIADKGEGIVIRNETTKEITKWVREDFREIKPTKQPKQQNLKALSVLESVLTEARVEKAIYKGLDENVYSDLSQSSYGSVMKFLGNYIIEDIFNEEFDLIDEEIIQEVSKLAKKKIPYLARTILDRIK